LGDTRYAKMGDIHVAYRSWGDGPSDIVNVPNWAINVEAIEDIPEMVRFTELVSGIGRYTMFDQPGTGISDPIPLDSLPGLEQWTDSTRAVIDDAGIEKATLFAIDGATMPACLFAATFPERTKALILFGGTARVKTDTDYAQGFEPDHAEFLFEAAGEAWGTAMIQIVAAPSIDWTELRIKRWSRYERMTLSPNAARAFFRLVFDADVRHVLPAIRVPTLVMHRAGDRFIPVEAGRYLGRNIPGAHYVELPGDDHYPFTGDVEPVVAEMQEFITGARTEAAPDRMLATILFTDIVGSTEHAVRRGDARWRQMLDEHDTMTRAVVQRFNGREVKNVGDGFLATFDGPARAIKAASEIRRSIKEIGIDVRAGLHTGECERRGDDVGGVAVHIGARVASLAAPGEILVSGTVKDLVIGSGIEFEDRGSHTLKGIPGEWKLYAVP
jgi:class 3 adenylate cyclase/pimeloyl-ACP methyl ester carboxylesterase